MKSQSRTGRGLTIGSIRRSFLYQPLAAILIIVLLPWATLITSGAGQSSLPFAAAAQSSACQSTNNSIIQNYCGDDDDPLKFFYTPDLAQLESDAVNTYLAAHGMNGVNNVNGSFVNTIGGTAVCVSGPVAPGAPCPAAGTDAQVIYDYGRTDLRSGIRGSMGAILRSIILKPAAQRTKHEQNLYNWLFGLVKSNEIRTYRNAVAHVNSFFNNPCEFTLDSDVAAVNNLSYSGQPFCYGLSSLFAPKTPNKVYFLAYGLKQGYGATAVTDPAFPRLVAQSSISQGAIAGIATASGALVAQTVTALLLPNLTGALVAWLTIGGEASLAADSAFVLSGFSVNSTSLAGATAGPAAIAFACVMIGIIAGLEVFEDEKVRQHVATLNADLTRVLNTPPDLVAMVQDKTGLGTYKLVSTLVSRTSPDRPSTRPLPLHRPGIDASIGDPGFANSLTYLGADINLWTVSTWGRWFVQTCANGSGHKFSTFDAALFPSGGVCVQSDSISADLHFIRSNRYNPAGIAINYPTWEPMVASRIGETMFNITKSKPRKNDIACPGDAYTGVTPILMPPLVTGRCLSFATRNPVLRGADGFTVETGLYRQSPPAFAPLAAPLTFSLGVPSSRVISATGTPDPTIALVSIDTFPQGFSGNVPFSLLDSTGNWNLNFTGTTDPTKAGTYGFRVKTSNQWGSETKTFTVTVTNNLAIVSSNTVTGTAGVPLTFKVVATGSPRPALSAQNLNQLGSFTFIDNLDGTGTLSGTYTSFSNDYICFGAANCPTITATSSQGTVRQNLAFSMPSPPYPSYYPASATFVAGINNQVVVKSSGAITPVSFAMFELPSWMTFRDVGDGTAIIAGTPPLTAANVSPFFYATVAGYVPLSQPFPITVRNAPLFISDSTTTLTVGSPASFDFKTNTGTISLLEALPSGLTLDTSVPTVARLRGTPAVGTGGSYKLSLSAATATDSAQQTFYLNINEGPKFISQDTATAFVGVPASISVSVSGFPSHSDDVVPGNVQPTDPADGLGMYYSVVNLPAAFKASNLSPQGLATGTLVITGTPSSADLGTYNIGITAANGVGPVATQTLRLTVLKSSGNAQTINFTIPPATRTFGDAPFSISASASSNLAVAFKSNTPSICSVSGSSVTMLSGGTCTIQADQAGDGNYSAAPPVTQSFFINAAATVLTWANPAPIQYGTPLSSTQLNAGSNGPGTYQYTPPTGTVLGAGNGQTLSVSFTPSDPSKYAAATKSVSIDVSAAPNSITFKQPADKALGSGTVALEATATSGGTVTFASSTPAVCTVSGASASLVSMGVCSITAMAPAGGNYLAATPVARSFTVLKPAPAITSFKVLWGTRSYEVVGATRNRLPWQITGVQVTFSSPIPSAAVNSLGGGLVATGLTGVGTSTLTWTIAPVALGQLNAMFSGAGANAIRNSDGTPLGNGGGASQVLRVLYGDYNDDGAVNASDQTLVLNLVRAATYNLFGDMNGDGVVDNSDVLLVRAQIGKSLP